MLLLTALGTQTQIRDAVDELDRHDPSPAEAVTWFEEKPGKFRIEIYVPTKQDADSARAIVGAAAPELHLVQKPVKAANWVSMSLEGLPAVRAGRFLVAGAHALQRQSGGQTKIWIEASEAFGTGHHGTTWGCLMGLEYYLRKRASHFPSPRGEGVRCERTTKQTPARRLTTLPSRRGGFSVLDVGAGSGVLAIAAAKTGGEALAIEIDPRAAAIAAVNAKQNRVAQRVRVVAGDGARHIAKQTFDLVFANILMRPLIRLAPRLAPAVAPGGALILSGLLRSQAPLVREAYASRGLVLERQIPRDAWMTLVWRKPISANRR